MLAWVIDFALIFALACTLGALAAHRIAAALSELPALAVSGVWQLFIAHGDTLVAAQGLGRQLWDDAVLIVIESCALLVAGTFLYHWAALAFAGRTLGKRVLDLHVVPGRVRGAVLRAAVTTVADVACLCVALCLLISGELLASFAAWVLAVGAFWANALPALSPSRRSLADRLAGTRVIRGGSPAR